MPVTNQQSGGKHNKKHDKKHDKKHAQSKKTFLDNYYSKMFLKKYFS